MPAFSKIVTKIFLPILFLISSFSFAQKNEAKLKEIEALSDLSYKSYTELKNEESLEYAKKGNKIALEIGDSKAIARTYNQIARAYTNMGKQKEALENIDKAMAEKFTKTDPIFVAKLILLKANNHSMLGLYEVANKEYFEALDLLKNETKPAAIREKISIYSLISYDFFNKGDFQSSLKYENLKIKLLKTFPEEEVASRISEMYDMKGSIFLETKKLDSAYHYLTKGYELKKKYNDPVMYAQYFALGDYHNQTGDTKKALEFYLKSVENYDSLQVEDPAIVKVYKDISDIYAKMGNKEKENFYLKKYSEANSEVQQSKAENTNEAVKMIVKEKDEKFNAFQSKSFLTIGGIVLGVAALIFGLFFWYKKTSKKTEEIISQKEEENHDLLQKVNESFDDIVQLAKTNSPEFFTRFQEVYPEYIEKLKEIYPEISIDDLRFCSLLKLNFSTKDIAEYTFVTIRTVQTRKSRLRKKFNIPSDEDIYLWMNELG